MWEGKKEKKKEEIPTHDLCIIRLKEPDLWGGDRKDKRRPIKSDKKRQTRREGAVKTLP